MAERKKLVILPKLCDFGGDMTKQWFVYYSYRSPKSGRMVRFRVYNGMAGAQEPEERYQHADKCISEIEKKIRSGWNPFDDDKDVIYEDQLKYSHLARKQGRLKKSNRTFNFYMSKWLDENKVNLSPATYTTYKSKYRIFQQWLEKEKLDRYEMACFDQEQARKFVKHLFDDRKDGNNTVHGYIRTLKSFFTWAIKKGVGIRNPFDEIHITKRPRKSAKYFNDTLLEKVKNEVIKRDKQLWLSVQLQYYCFIRPGREQIYMLVGDIDIHQGTIQVRGEIAKNKMTKTVVIPEPFLKYLIEIGIDKYPAENYLFGNQGIPGPIHLGKNHLYNQFVKVRIALNLPKDYKLYSFKHTGAVKASKVVTIKDLQMQLRHSDLGMVDEYLKQMQVTDSDDLREKFPEM